MKAALAALAICCASMAIAQPWTSPVADDVTTADLDRAVRDFPYSGALLRRRAGVAREAGDSATVRDALNRLAALGGSLSAAGREAVRLHFDEAQWAALAARMDANAAPVGESRVAYAIDAEFELVEGVALDCAERAVYAGTVAGRSLLNLDDAGWAAIHMPAETGGLFGMAFDEPRRTLWIASGVAAPTPRPETAFRGLIALDTRTNATRMIAAPEGVSPGDVAVGLDGAVYVSEGTLGGVWRLAPGGVAFEPLVAPGAIQSSQGIAVSVDGASIYVASYGYGIARVDLASGAIARLASDAPVMLDGIDGLIRDGGALIAIRNGANPRAILRLTLSADGSRIASVETLERANPEWGEPTLGAVCDGVLLYNSDAQWERYPDGATPDLAIPQRPTRLRALRLRD